ncbi:MAG: rRNA maturation RNase YbeY [Lachnospiraceae bacterium]|nr:rRNA maturation RNase YbeY [Lachnospiraceae bacterium]
MTFYLENEHDETFDFDPEDVIRRVMEQVLSDEACPYDAEVNVLMTDNAGIHAYNKAHRGIDSPTDVLSFPNIEYSYPSDFSHLEEDSADYFDPDSGDLILGDIIISTDKVREQAKEYGHSEKREFAFLLAHSFFHLCGYDHMTPDEAAVMEKKQEDVLQKLGITRE